MAHLGGTIATAVVVFTTTNVDLFALLVVLFLGSRNGGLRIWQIVLGQYLAFAVTIAASAVIAAGLAVVPNEWVGLLGVVPLALGVRGLLTASRDTGERRPLASGRVPVTTVAALSVSVGGDNLSVYVVLFRTQTPVASAISAAMFLGLLALWCVAARAVATHKR